MTVHEISPEGGFPHGLHFGPPNGPHHGPISMWNDTCMWELLHNPVYFSSMIQEAMTGRFLNVAAITLYAYYLLLTLDDEVKYIWLSRASTLKYAFLVQRYLPLADVGHFIIVQSMTGVDLPACDRANKISSYTLAFGMTLSETILSLRIWSIWRRSYKIGLLMVGFFCAVGCVVLIYLTIYLNSLNYLTFPLPHLSCLFDGDRRAYSVVWSMIVLTEVFMTVLMIIGVAKNWDSGRDNNLIRLIYRDGVRYYLGLLALSITNICVILAAPMLTGFIIVAPLERVVHALITSRIIFDIRREAALAEETIDDDSDIAQEGSVNANVDLESLHFAVPHDATVFSVTNEGETGRKY